MAGNGVPVFVVPRFGLLAVEALIVDYRKAELILDTGSTHCSISPRVANELGLVPSGDGRRLWRNTEAGDRVQEPLYSLPTLTLGGIDITGLDVIVSAWPARLGVHGILGLNFFRRFHRVLFDVDSMLMSLE